MEESIRCYQEAVRRLRMGGSEGGRDGRLFVEDYEAEGLFSLCAVLIKILLTQWLVEHWDTFAPTFERYLAHPASTVRQSASRLFFYLVAKDGGNLPLTVRVLASLTDGWGEQLETGTDGNAGRSPPNSSSPLAAVDIDSPGCKMNQDENVLRIELKLRAEFQIAGALISLLLWHCFRVGFVASAGDLPGKEGCERLRCVLTDRKLCLWQEPVEDASYAASDSGRKCPVSHAE
eukprot:SAG31_NODE_1888_length_6987_cov_1.481852_9_plen_233_part_00